jgi:hypothetical protein
MKPLNREAMPAERVIDELVADTAGVSRCANE